jgi:hypothetical protein
MYNTGVRFEERVVRTRVAPHSIYLLGSSAAAGPAAVAGATVAAHLQHRVEAQGMEAEEREAALQAAGATAAPPPRGPLLVVLCLSAHGCPSPAAEAAVAAASARLVGARCQLLRAKETYADSSALPVRLASARLPPPASRRESRRVFGWAREPSQHGRASGGEGYTMTLSRGCVGGAAGQGLHSGRTAVG